MHDNNGFFGPYGGSYVPEILIHPLQKLTTAYEKFSQSPCFQNELKSLLQNYVGRSTPLYHAERLSKYLGGAQIYLKREDLTHTGAHKINNTMGQGLLAKYMKKSCLIAETGAGQHGVATATVASLLGLKCVIFMGQKDMERQKPNVLRMRLLGAQIHAVKAQSATLKDATSEAMRYWVSNLHDCYYVLGSALGPHPYPSMVRDFQSIIGEEARSQILEQTGKLPNELIACVGGGSNAIGLFHAFLDDHAVKMTGVEAGGHGDLPRQHAARFQGGMPGILQGTKSYLLQDHNGFILPTSSISAGLDYPGVGPEHAYLHDCGRVHYTVARDQEALHAAMTLCEYEGIIPALESAHALAYALKKAPSYQPDFTMLVNLSGRGDKDLETLTQHLESES